MSAPLTLALINGFLGAGKTTLIAAAAKRLQARGRRVAVITNDQAADLVDTHNLRGQGLDVAEVAGGCFCCQFDGLMATLDGLCRGGSDPEIVLAEAVGSCTDISATVVQPLKDLHRDRVRLAPFTVMVDAPRLKNAVALAAEDQLGRDVLYIFDRQVEEADLMLLNKTDLVPPAEVESLAAEMRRRRPGTPLIATAARAGVGVEAWIDALLTDAGSGTGSGRAVLSIDYDRYAAGEAELGWLNARLELAQPAASWRDAALALVERLRAAFRSRSAAIAHLKVALSGAGGSLVIGLPDAEAETSLSETGHPDPAAPATLVLNARIRLAPEALRAEVERALPGTAGTMAILEMSAFRPARPQPTHRYAGPVA